MKDTARSVVNVPSGQQSIRSKCFHPSNSFVEFKKEEIEQSISDRFEQIARMFPDHLAVKTSTDELTYGALNNFANCVAQTILARSEKREEPVALLLEKGAPLIAAILGVLKAGKIYVPLDRSYPRARTNYIVEDSEAGLIITNNRNLSTAKELVDHQRQLINLDEQAFATTPENPGLFMSPDSVSYVMYTSGSTGKPKGVVQNHRNVLHKVMQYANAIHVCADDRLTLFRSLSVSGSIRDMFGGLLTGAAILPFDLKDGALVDRARWLLQEEITIYNAVAALFRHFVGTLTEGGNFPKIRLVKVSGEPVYKKDVELYKRQFSQDCIMLNMLASSETGTVRMYFIDKKTQIRGNHVPVGYSVDHTEVLLLDDAGNKVGFNQIGEIAVKSRYLPLGYWRKPELTRAAFLPNTEGGDERIYHTRDLGEMMSDGCLVHLGRKDLRVKIRGYSVEVAEVELALNALANIKEAVVGTRKGVAGDQQLIAYIVSRSQPGPTVSELRRVLGESLPDYMLPAAFVTLDALPLTPNGKVDRRMLPELGSTRPQLDTSFIAPRTPVEEELAKIWAQMLSLDQVGIHDDFFDLGGHSLLATQVTSRVINCFKVDLPIKSLFDSPTVADMAMIITQNETKKARPEDLARMLTEVESLSDEEAQRLLARESEEASNKGSSNE